MKISLIGYGKMGREVESLANSSEHFEVYSTIDPISTDALYKEINKESVQGADVCIDFTSPDSVVENIRKVCSLGKDIVVGTTGWYDSLDEVKSIVMESDVGFIFAPNFSLGVNVYYRILEKIGKDLKRLDYDPAVIEMHHDQKLDAPSGTAKKIKEILKQSGYENIPISSVRVGSIVGTHTTIFDSQGDSIEITHAAKSREGFAKGALEAARWIRNKKGLYTFDQMLEDIFGE
ncbi:MAG: 4-hydroxy-tetrahydrodipicolinate reductase [Candidatus Aenigmatarchaeota archaeon]